MLRSRNDDWNRRIIIGLVGWSVAVLATAQEHPARYSGEQLQADFAVFQEAMEEAHPGLYVHRAPAEIAEVFARQSARLEKGGGEWVLYRALATVISAVQDGHTGANLSLQGLRLLDASDAFLPFKLEVIGDSAFLFRDYSEGHPELLGARVVAVGGRPWREIEATLMAHRPSDGATRTGERRELGRSIIFGRHFQMIWGTTSRYSLDLELEGVRRTVVVPAISYATLSDRFEARYADSAARERFALSFPERPTRTAVLRIGAFAGDEYEAFLDDSFQQIAARDTRHLVIDLRGNGGGRERYGQRLVRYLVQDSFRTYDRIVVTRRRFPSLQLSDRRDLVYIEDDATAAADGTLLVTRPYARTLAIQSPLTPHFAGDVYVLLDGASFSTTADTLTSLDQLNRAVFVGTEAGGNYYGNTSGTTAELTLPHTKVRVWIPLERFYNHVTDSDRPKNRGLIPDHVIEPTIDDLLAGRDPVLEAAYALIREDDR